MMVEVDVGAVQRGNIDREDLLSMMILVPAISLYQHLPTVHLEIVMFLCVSPPFRRASSVVG